LNEKEKKMELNFGQMLIYIGRTFAEKAILSKKVFGQKRSLLEKGRYSKETFA
jgi:hypothetical protein